MIRSRVFFALGTFLLLTFLLIYAFVDFREKEDKAYAYFSEKQYEEVIDLYKEDLSVDSEGVLALLSESISRLERKANDSKDRDAVLSFLKKIPKIKVIEWETGLGIYNHIEDPYFPLLKKHSTYHKRALVTKVSSFSKMIPKDKAAYYLLLLILEDPRGLEQTYGEALANILRYPFDSIGEIETGFLLQTLHLLSTSTTSLFFENYYSVNGKNVNLRSGPGKENKEVGKVSNPETTFCFEKDNTEETLAGKTGHWVQCYFPGLGKSAWLFSGFLSKEEPNQSYVGEFQKRFKSIEDETRIDFEGWTGEKIPSGFYGKYIPREREVDSGKPGFVLFGSKTDKWELICKKIEGEKNYFEFSYKPTDSQTNIPLFEIRLVSSGISHPAYSIHADKESISIGKNRYILDDRNGRENLSLHIESRKGNKLLASLWRRNTVLLQKIDSSPMDESSLKQGNDSWEVCLPQAISPNREKVILFEIRTGVH
ncbi:hypothetical protein LPTSP3_g21840 [Leptospira kobayashii]|uniref:SH3b domain-containing protein n=1 Tax=Leptospira kobayashii TaxID=1917830 RepID=A0ABM7UKF8_9LEPT|nr:hypothetical protein [Leptospira kobayashii]BDA79254.1 hypothetical protein LPTSP3_g21840 [Leptospira kobayashii]